MSNWNSIQNELRKWTPRQPSPELRSRIFGKQAEAIRFHLPDFSRLLAPVFACFVLVMATLSTRMHEHDAFRRAATNDLLPGFDRQNNQLVLAQSINHSGVNAVPVKRMEWNFGAARPVAIGAALVSYTNKLIQ
jgi:hypothetical protein